MPITPSKMQEDLWKISTNARQTHNKYIQSKKNGMKSNGSKKHSLKSKKIEKQPKTNVGSHNVYVSAILSGKVLRFVEFGHRKRSDVDFSRVPLCSLGWLVIRFAGFPSIHPTWEPPDLGATRPGSHPTWEPPDLELPRGLLKFTFSFTFSCERSQSWEIRNCIGFLLAMFPYVFHGISCHHFTVLCCLLLTRLDIYIYFFFHHGSRWKSKRSPPAIVKPPLMTIPPQKAQIQTQIAKIDVRKGSTMEAVLNGRAIKAKALDEYSDNNLWETKIKVRTFETFVKNANESSTKLSAMKSDPTNGDEACKLSEWLFNWSTRADGLHASFQLARTNSADFLRDFATHQIYFSDLPAHLACNVITIICGNVMLELTQSSSEAFFGIATLVIQPDKLTLGNSSLPKFSYTELQHSLLCMWYDKVLRSCSTKPDLATILKGCPVAFITREEVSLLQARPGQGSSDPISVEEGIDGGFSLLVRLELSALRAMCTSAATTDPDEKLKCKLVVDGLRFTSIRMQSTIRGSNKLAKQLGLDK
jgi:hypothetical protein